MTALLTPVLLVTASSVVDVSQALAEKANLQEILDGGVLAAATQSNATMQRNVVEGFLAALTVQNGMTISSNLSLTTNADGSLTGTFREALKTPFLGAIGGNQFTLSVTSTALAAQQTASTAAQPCIYVLANKSNISLVVDTMIMNSTNWQIEPYAGGTAFSAAVVQSSTPRLGY